MVAITGKEKLVNLLNADESMQAQRLDFYLHQRKKTKLGTVLCYLAGNARIKAMHAYFIEHDIEKAKQNFYLASKLTLASVDQEGGASFEIVTDIQTALLSDSPEAIDAIARVETPKLVDERNNPLYKRFHVYMLQLAIRGQDDAVRAMIEKVAKHGRNPLRKECAEGREFYSLLLNGDKAGLEDLIQNKHAHMKSQDPIDEEFMSFPGTFETKLCWYRGIPIEIDHPLVPMELMPIRPLAHYDDVYDFLKPGWVPPPQGLMDKLGRWLGRSA